MQFIDQSEWRSGHKMITKRSAPSREVTRWRKMTPGGCHLQSSVLLLCQLLPGKKKKHICPKWLIDFIRQPAKPPCRSSAATSCRSRGRRLDEKRKGGPEQKRENLSTILNPLMLRGNPISHGRNWNLFCHRNGESTSFIELCLARMCRGVEGWNLTFPDVTCVHKWILKERRTVDIFF